MGDELVDETVQVRAARTAAVVDVVKPIDEARRARGLVALLDQTGDPVQAGGRLPTGLGGTDESEERVDRVAAPVTQRAPAVDEVSDGGGADPLRRRCGNDLAGSGIEVAGDWMGRTLIGGFCPVEPWTIRIS